MNTTNVRGSGRRAVGASLMFVAAAVAWPSAGGQAFAAPSAPVGTPATEAAAPGAPVARPPVAQAPRPASPRTASSLDEGLGGRQFGYGALGAVGTTVLGLSLGFVAVLNDGQESAETIMGITGWVVPLVAGMIVCRVGKDSLLYDGRCFPAVVGAYVGGLAMIPIGLAVILAGCASDNSSDDGCVTSIIGSLVLGLAIGPPVGALIAWNLGKRSKEPQPASPPHAFGGAAPAGFASLSASWTTPLAADLQSAARRDFAASGGMRLHLLAFSF